jgi:hypothetical protein
MKADSNVRAHEVRSARQRMVRVPPFWKPLRRTFALPQALHRDTRQLGIRQSRIRLPPAEESFSLKAPPCDDLSQCLRLAHHGFVG